MTKQESVVVISDFPYIEATVKSIKKNNSFALIAIVAKRKKESLNHDFFTIYDQVYFVDDYYNKTELSSAVEQILQNYSITRIIAPLERTVEYAGFLRDKYKIDGTNYETSILCRDKNIMKHHLSQLPIKMAKHYLINSKQDIEKVSFDKLFIAKPPSGSGTRNVHLIQTRSEAIELLSREEEYQLEEFINGEEYHCDTVIDSKGNIRFSSIGKYLHNCFDTTEKNKPLGTIQIDETFPFYNDILNINAEVIHFLHLSGIVTHAEFFISEGDVYFSEIAIRVGGGPVISGCIKRKYNVDLFHEFVINQLELPDESHIIKDDNFWGCLSLPVQKGYVKAISAQEQILSMPSVTDCEIYYSVKDYIKADLLGTIDRTGIVFFCNENYDQIRKDMTSVFENFLLEVIPS